MLLYILIIIAFFFLNVTSCLVYICILLYYAYHHSSTLLKKKKTSTGLRGVRYSDVNELLEGFQALSALALLEVRPSSSRPINQLRVVQSTRSRKKNLLSALVSHIFFQLAAGEAESLFEAS